MIRRLHLLSVLLPVLLLAGCSAAPPATPFVAPPKPAPVASNSSVGPFYMPARGHDATLPPLISSAAAAASVSFKPLEPAETQGRTLSGVRILGDDSTPLSDKGLELVYDSNVRLMERPMRDSQDASDTMRGVMGGDFDKRYMTHLTVNGLPAVGWNPVNDTVPGGRGIGYSGLVWVSPDGKMLYTLFGGTTLTYDQLQMMAESLK